MTEADKTRLEEIKTVVATARQIVAKYTSYQPKDDRDIQWEVEGLIILVEAQEAEIEELKQTQSITSKFELAPEWITMNQQLITEQGEIERLKGEVTRWRKVSEDDDVVLADLRSQLTATISLLTTAKEEIERLKGVATEGMTKVGIDAVTGATSVGLLTIKELESQLTAAREEIERLKDKEHGATLNYLQADKERVELKAEIERLKVALRSANRLIEPGAETQATYR